MLKKFLSLFLSAILLFLLAGNWINVQAQSPQKLIPISIAFNPKTDAQTYRPANLKQADQPSRSVIGEDNRVPVTKQEFPWAAIGRIYWILDGGKRQVGYCTGTLIGKDLVLTNSHCLEHPITEKIVDPETYQSHSDRIVFVPNMIEGGFNRQDVAVVTANYIYGWKSGTKTAADWALLKINKPLGEKYGYLGWRSLDLSDQRVLDKLKQQVRLAGYSGDYPDEKQRLANKLRGQAGETAGVHLGCSVEGLVEGIIIHNCDTMGGASGSAMLARFDDGNYYIVGLHRGSTDLNPDSVPANFREKCKRFDDKGEIITVGACRNLSVQVSQWSAQAAKMRSERSTEVQS